MVVHGWGVGAPGATVDYTLKTWDVPAASGGTLTASAPATVNLGEASTITLGWPSDLASGSYLGLVSHTASSGVGATTIVEVDG